MITNRWFGATLAGLIAAGSVGVAQAAEPYQGSDYSAHENARQVELSAFEARQERAQKYHFAQPGDDFYIQREVWDGGVLPKAPRAENPALSNLSPAEFSAFEARQERAQKYHFKKPGDSFYIQREVWDGGVLALPSSPTPSAVSGMSPAEFSAFELRQERARQYHYKQPGDDFYIQREVWD